MKFQVSKISRMTVVEILQSQNKKELKKQHIQ